MSNASSQSLQATCDVKPISRQGLRCWCNWQMGEPNRGVRFGGGLNVSWPQQESVPSTLHSGCPAKLPALEGWLRSGGAAGPAAAATNIFIGTLSCLPFKHSVQMADSLRLGGALPMCRSPTASVLLSLAQPQLCETGVHPVDGRQEGGESHAIRERLEGSTFELPRRKQSN